MLLDLDIKIGKGTCQFNLLFCKQHRIKKFLKLVETFPYKYSGFHWVPISLSDTIQLFDYYKFVLGDV